MRTLKLTSEKSQISTESSFSRLLIVDAVRGVAIAGVVIFHLVWDLEFTGFISGLAFHPAWLAFGNLLAGTFMFLVGVSLVLAHRKHFNLAPFLYRTAIIALCAFAISVVTFFTFRDAFVYYGILHAIAVGSLIGVLFLRLPTLISLVTGLAVLLAPLFISSALFNSRWLAWIGFAEMPAQSNDFVPIFPWAGLTLLGLAFAKFVHLEKPETIAHIKRLNARIPASLTWMGRHSLAIYLIHQPVLLAVIVPASRLF